MRDIQKTQIGGDFIPIAELVFTPLNSQLKPLYPVNCPGCSILIGSFYRDGPLQSITVYTSKCANNCTEHVAGLPGRRGWIRFTYLVGPARPGARETRECVIFFDIGEHQLLTQESLALFNQCLQEGAIPPHASRRGTGRRGRGKSIRPDGLMALHYHLLRKVVKKLSLPRKEGLRAGGTEVVKIHVAAAWGLQPSQTETVRRAQRLHKKAAEEVIGRLTDDEARGLLVQVNTLGVEFARTRPPSTPK